MTLADAQEAIKTAQLVPDVEHCRNSPLQITTNRKCPMMQPVDDDKTIGCGLAGLLLGNSFPLSLIRRAVSIQPRPLVDLLAAMQGRAVFSFWGHANTLSAVCRLLGRDVAPLCVRPVLTLDRHDLPCLAGRSFAECWVLSPEYAETFRPELGQEVAESAIVAWRVLHICWH